jgi:hypothetical protein
MRRTLSTPLVPGIIIDTPGASLFFFRFWESVVDEGTKSKEQWWSTREKSFATACNREALEQARAAADQRTDRAIGLVKLAQGIDCAVSAGWSVWMRSGKWADLPLLENTVRDRQFGEFPCWTAK